jgi:hypothetical protein
MSNHLPSKDVAEQLIKAINGEEKIGLLNPGSTWDRTYAGDCWFKIGDWQVAFYNDCNSLDYTEKAIAPDGRTADFDDWCVEGAEQHGHTVCFCPLYLLTYEQQDALQELLQNAT